MNATEQRHLMEGMRDRDGISPFVIRRVYEAFCGHGLDAHGKHIGEVALALARQGHVSRETATTISALNVYAPASGCEYNSGIVLKTDQGIFLVVIEWPGKPNPRLDQLLDSALEKKGIGKLKRPERRGPDYSRASKIEAILLHSEEELQAALMTAQQEFGSLGSRDLLIRTFSSHRFGDDQKWISGNVVLAADTRWQPLFAALRQVLSAHDAVRIATDAAEYGTREFRGDGGPNGDLKDYEAARCLGLSTAADDSFLPAENTAAMISALECFKAEADVRHLLDRGFLPRIYENCVAHGHRSKADEFEYNDLRDYAYATEQGGLVSLHLRDQNRCTRADFKLVDGALVSLDVWSARAHQLEPLDRLATFVIGVDHQVTTASAPSTELDKIRAWSSFVVCVESADCCLTEEYPPGRLSP